MIFKNYPLNQFKLKVHSNFKTIKPFGIKEVKKKYICTSEEISSIFHFPNKPIDETSLLKVTAKKLSLPRWVPIFDFKRLKNWELVAKDYPKEINIVWTSDFRSIKVPVGTYILTLTPSVGDIITINDVVVEENMTQDVGDITFP